jgi:DNA-directed RNA polymerase specialized sigma24 family protein
MLLVEHYYTQVLGVAYQVVGDATLAARATTTIFGRTRRLRLTAGQEPVALWRTALKVLRGYRARGLTVTPIVPDSADWQTVLLKQLARLDPDDRILLLLRYHEGLDDRALAEILGVDRQTARDRLARARNRLLTEQGHHALR